ncbi:MarR family winged helix-turn-helix transcriptional regulator [Zhihengliuella halotolerans]|uniref:DNA-binding MarR family transcriptional regulator n=1 Tax=Zhihengliuella halotolerans TaxID=370736 RepID=A0A4Q8ABW2_9MICC|nr:MarR family transcriptional regulator [Zhihengliuella halotolerans]RZU61618.1 DNA-binding MarR family transcriptional regulator [Zhihengliuella halotolerans]
MAENNNLPSVSETAQAWESLFRCQVTIMRRLQALSEFRELNMREYDVLFNLKRAPDCGLRLGDLNEHLLLSQPSLSRMIDRLVERGLVARIADPSDARAVLITLTEEGAELQRRIGRAHVRHIHEVMAGGLTPDELAELKRLTQALSDSVQSC